MAGQRWWETQKFQNYVHQRVEDEVKAVFLDGKPCVWDSTMTKQSKTVRDKIRAAVAAAFDKDPADKEEYIQQVRACVEDVFKRLTSHDSHMSLVKRFRGRRCSETASMPPQPT